MVPEQAAFEHNGSSVLQPVNLPLEARPACFSSISKPIVASKTYDDRSKILSTTSFVAQIALYNYWNAQ